MTTISLLVVAASSLGGASNSVVLDFTASWCGPCQQMSPIVARLQRQGYPIRTVNVDAEPELTERFRIKSIPAFVRIVDGREEDRFIGILSEARLRQMATYRPAVRKDERATLVGGPPGESSRPHVRDPQDAVERPEPRRTPASTPATASSPPASPKPTSKPVFPFSLFRKRAASVAVSEASKPPETTEDLVVRAKNADVGSRLAILEPVQPSSSCVRVRVKHDGSISFGSGTIIDSRQGCTLVLTCGHVLRDIDPDSKVEVDVFVNDRFETYVGRVVRYDLKADVGLVSIPTAGLLTAIEVASATSYATPGDHVLSVGCSSGEPPTQKQHRVTARNRYLGPDNIECTGMPVQGRSGGGLFDLSGRLVGVCIAADPRDQRGLYAGLEAVHKLLDDCQLSHLYNSVNVPEQHGAGSDAIALGTIEREAVETGSLAARELTGIGNLSGSGPGNADWNGVESPEFSKGIAPNGAQDSPSLATEFTGAEDAEIVCIIRPLNKPRAASRIVIINRASEKFVADLTGELAAQTRLTSGSRPDTAAAEPEIPSRFQRYRRSTAPRR